MNLKDARSIAKAVPDVVFEVAISRDGNGMAIKADIGLVESLAKDLPVVDVPTRGENYLYIRCALVERRPIGT